MCPYYVLSMITGAEDIDRKKKNDLYLCGIPYFSVRVNEQTNKPGD